MSLYERDHRTEDLRRLLLRATKYDESSSSGVIYPVDYLLQLRIQGLATAADKLLELGFAADSVLLYNQAIGLSATMAPDSPRYFVTGNGEAGYFNEGLTRALEAVTPAELAASLSRLLQAEESPNPAQAKPKESNAAARGGRERGQGEERRTVPGHDGAHASARAGQGAVAQPARRSDHRGAREGRDCAENGATAPRRERLRRSRKRSEETRRVPCRGAREASGGPWAFRSAKHCERFRATRRGSAAPAVSRLVELVKKTPLEPLEPGERANARQRAVAARQIPLWLVARACWNQEKSDKSAELAEMFAKCALEAARRQTDNTFYLAMIREQGERALEKGDRAAAVAAWERMLEIVVSPPKAKVKKPVQAPGAAPAGNPPPAATKRASGRSGASLPARRGSLVRLASYQSRPQGAGVATEKGKAESQQTGKTTTTTVSPRTKGATAGPGPARKAVGASRAGTGAGARRSNLPILTLDRFEQAMQIARLAAEHDLPELCLKAVHDSLRAGPPVVPSENRGQTVRMMRAGVEDVALDPASPRVVTNLMQLDPIWQKHKFAAAAVYEALRTR